MRVWVSSWGLPGRARLAKKSLDGQMQGKRARREEGLDRGPGSLPGAG